MAKSTNRVFQFTASTKKAQVAERLWYPAADVYQTPEGWVVKVELAGVFNDEIKIGWNYAPGLGPKVVSRDVMERDRSTFRAKDWDDLNIYLESRRSRVRYHANGTRYELAQ